MISFLIAATLHISGTCVTIANYSLCQPWTETICNHAQTTCWREHHGYDILRNGIAQ